MMAYIDHIRAHEANVEKILLLSKQHLLPFYTRCGFTYVGEAEVKLGQLYKMLIEFLYKFCNCVNCVMCLTAVLS